MAIILNTPSWVSSSKSGFSSLGGTTWNYENVYHIGSSNMLSLRKTTKKSSWLMVTPYIQYPTHENTISLGWNSVNFYRQVFSQLFPSHLCRGCVVYPTTFLWGVPRGLRWMVSLICFLSVWWIHTPIQKPNSRTKINTIKNNFYFFLNAYPHYKKRYPDKWLAIHCQNGLRFDIIKQLLIISSLACNCHPHVSFFNGFIHSHVFGLIWNHQL